MAAIFRTPVFNPTERFIQDQAAALTRWRPLIVGLERKGWDGDAILPGSALERALFALRGRGGSIERRLRAAHPRLIHAHFGTDGLRVLPLARALGVPLVTSLRGYDVTRSDAALLRSGRLGSIRYALGKSRLQREGALFLAVSDALRRRAIARGFPEERTLTHHNGVDLDRFRPGEEPREPGLILHVGRLVEKKGTKVLIEALAGLPGARLVVIGDGPLRGALERRAGPAVQFLGALPALEVARWMRRAAVLAAPSLTAADGDAEGLPNVVVEAAASGLPVVATHHSGIPEAVEEGRTGFLVPEGDCGALAGALAAALRAGPEMGEAARALAEERFDRVRLGARLEQLYDEVAASDEPGEG
ncbi:MAG TPA: glycosyltransferase [Allosphingosinicella sp.]|nr:glycosyltransferase [Allosphingosinicella sp.]